MQQKTKSRLSSAIFISSCLLICALSLVYFFYDLNKVSFKAEPEIGFIQFKRKLAQRRFSNSVVWERLVQNSPLYDEDIISTDADSEAIITFNSGTNISLDENTMIQVFEQKDGDLSLNVESGRIDIDTTDATKKITVGFESGYKVELDTGSKVSASSQQKGTDFVIHQGSAKSISVDGTENVILQGQSIKVDTEGNSKKNLISTKDFSSNQKVYVVEDQQKTIEFNFNIEDEAKNQVVIFETSDFEDFKIITFSKEITDAITLDVSNEDSDFYYRAFLKEDQENLTSGKISLVKIEIPKLEKTENTPVFTTTEPEADVFLTWQEFEYSDYSILRIYKISNSPVTFSDAEIEQLMTTKNLVLEKKITNNSITVPDLAEGSYAYKISPHYPKADTELNVETDPELFYVQQAEKVEVVEFVLPEVELVTFEEAELELPAVFESLAEEIPAIEETTIVEELPEDLPEILPEEKLAPQKEEASVSKEKLVTEQKTTQKAEATAKPVKVPLAKVNLLEPANSFTVTDEYLGKNRKIAFSWQEVKDATEYKFTLYEKNENGNTKQIFNKTVTEAHLDFTELPLLDVGQFEWEVKPIQKDASGSVTNEGESSVFTFNISFDLPTDVETDSDSTMYGN